MKEDPCCRERILEDYGIREGMQRIQERFHPGWGALRRFLLRPVYRFLPAIGIHPLTFYGWLRRKKRGESVREHRRDHGTD